MIANLRGEAFGEIEIRLPEIVTQKAIVRSTLGLEAGISEIEELLRTCWEAFDTVREGVVSGLYGLAPREAKGRQLLHSNHQLAGQIHPGDMNV